ncbi:NADPH-dependent F420 reductase [Massilia aurea]|uniref:NADPH-dependent F420 reductase n=1 Tax=Massilia aurea TaxID=373040 RepID=UPI0021638309|nr:NAD(P)-binding domain-containing protein [Massilia aurea]MCS0709019.1 NAD(P)-binding domain-containing protein [Massilia aurea]
MKIGILGTGNIGKTLVVRLSQAGHEVKVANSRGPETIDKGLLSSGALAVTTENALTDVEVVILSIPLNRIRDIASLVAGLPAETVVIDTSNYYPFRDEKIDAIEQGQAESMWVAEQLGRPIVKAWNAIGSASLARKSKPVGASDRIAIPVAADRDHDRKVAMSLVNDTGLDAFDAGSLADSWRQQPGAPVYCTDLSYSEIGAALDAAQRDRLPKRRDLGVAVMQERLGDSTTNPDEEWGVRLVRAINM